jgi:hypothetical protein
MPLAVVATLLVAPAARAQDPDEAGIRAALVREAK